MHSTYRTRRAAFLARCCTLIAVAGVSVAVQAQPAGIAPEAQRLLKASTDFLASQKQFSVDTRITLEVVLKSGQKIEFNHTALPAGCRPETSGGVEYQNCGGVHYRAAFQGNNLVYVVQ